MSTVEDPLIGKVLSGRFEIVSQLGAGGMGRVYKAIQRPLDRVVALKVLHPRYAGSNDPGFEKRFFLEASMTAKLKHPNTITVHDYGRADDGTYYLAMEYVEGETLQQALTLGALSWPRALNIGAQISRSLREAHKLGLVHRDLKPANIMLLAEGTGGDVVKVLDFGLVKSFLPEAQQGVEQPSSHPEITQAGVLLGSPLYMAPEQARNEADQRTDIYALGALLFQCISGRPPFLGTQSLDLIVQHLREAPPQLRSLVTELPPAVNALVMKCLEKSPDARFQNMDELLEAMRLATRGQGLSSVCADPRVGSRAGESGSPIATPAGTRLAEKAALIGNSVEVEFSLTGERPARSRVRLYIGVAAVSVMVVAAGVGATLAVKAQSEPTSTSLPVVVVAPPRVAEPIVPPVQVAQPVRVDFNVDTEPPGATVSQGGRVVGTTPLTMSVEREGPAPAQVELTFSLEGFEEASVVAQGVAGTVQVRQRLTERPAPVPTPANRPTRRKAPAGKPETPAGYKDDPYQ